MIEEVSDGLLAAVRAALPGQGTATGHDAGRDASQDPHQPPEKESA